MTSIRLPLSIVYSLRFIVLGLFYLPMLVVASFSFNSAARGMIWEGFSVRWYAGALSDPSLLAAMRTTGIIMLLTTVCSLIGGSVCAYLLATDKKGLRGAVLLSLLAPVLTPDLIGAIAFSRLLHFLGANLGTGTIVLSQLFFGVAYVALFITMWLRTIRFQDYVLAAESLGASPLRVFLDIFIPLTIVPSLAGAGVVAAISLQDFLYAFFCGGSGAKTVSVLLYGMVRFGTHTTLHVLYVLIVVLAGCLQLVGDGLLERSKAR